jgi:hypothetical protein
VAKGPVPRVSAIGLAARQHRAAVIAEMFGFIGIVEYRHVYSQSGGAQYTRGVGETNDLLTVYAEAFDRDADPEDFSLEAIIAHERGHQILARHPSIGVRMAEVSIQAEEVLASLLGMMLCQRDSDRDMLYAKTAAGFRKELSPEAVVRIMQDLCELLEAML